MVDVLADGIVKTRKPHKCHGCQEVIPAGTMVYRQTCVDDGIYTIYMCDSCRKWCANQVTYVHYTDKPVKGCQDCIDNEQAYEGYVKECRRDNERR
jgi:predicted RNA-binding Zn-ribbon protein involved in translation (DUF1610 family)